MAEDVVERPILDLLASMTADSLEASNLDADALMMVRIATLVASMLRLPRTCSTSALPASWASARRRFKAS